MRYYKIVITSPTTGAVLKQWSSHFNGKADPGAPQIELDIPTTAWATPIGGSLIRIWGISVADIAATTNLNQMNIAIYGGMAAGLPLATAQSAYQGLIAQGFIFQSFGNWIGTNMTLDLILQPGIGTIAKPLNLVQAWKKGTSFAAAIAQTLQTAFPGVKPPTVNISPNLVLAHDETGFWRTLPEYARYVKQVSQDIVGGNYAGVDITLSNNALSVYDGTTQSTPKQIQFTDLVGQPTWIGSNEIQVTSVMRADINVGGYIKIPPTLVTTTQAAVAQTSGTQKNTPAFQGTYAVSLVRHIGNFRSPDGAQWVTTINAFLTSSNTSATATTPGAAGNLNAAP